MVGSAGEPLKKRELMRAVASTRMRVNEPSNDRIVTRLWLVGVNIVALIAAMTWIIWYKKEQKRSAG